MLDNRVADLIRRAGTKESPAVVWRAIDQAAVHTPLSRIQVIEQLEEMSHWSDFGRASLVDMIGVIAGGVCVK